MPWANGYVDYLKLVNAQGRHQRRQDHLRGMRDRLRHRPGRRVLRAPEGQERRRDAVPAAVHRHHVRADRQGARRQDPAHHRRLRPQRSAGRQRLQVELPARRHLLGRRRHAGPARRQEGRRLRQAQGQEDRARLPRQPLRQGADPAAAGARQDARLRAAAAPGDAPGRRAEGDLAADPPEPARLRVPVGLGRDELDRAQGSAWPPATRARRCTASGGPPPSPTSRTSATAPRATTAWRCSTAPSRTPKIIKDILEQVHDKGQGTGPEGGGRLRCSTCAALMSAMLGVEGVRRAQERYGKGKVMTGEQVRWGLENLALDQKKLDALGFAGVMRPISTSCADHMGAAWARIHTWDGTKWDFTSDWLQADERSSSRWSSRRRRSTRPRRSSSAQRDAAEDCQSSCQRSLEQGGPRRGPSSKRRARRFEEPNDEHCAFHPARCQRHRGHLQPRDPGAEGRVAAGARGPHRRAAGRQRRRQDDDAARGQQPARRRARRGDQGLDRAARRAHRAPQHLRHGRARRHPGDGRTALLRATSRSRRTC